MATWDRYKTNTTGLDIIAQLGSRFTPRFYCDDPAGGVYTTKAPKAVLSLDPVVQFTNTNIAWDVSASISASGTIDTFDLTFGGGGASNLTGQDWSSDPKSGNVQYTSTGTFTVTLYVTDTAGNRSQAAKQQVTIIDGSDEDISDSTQKVYIATSDTGIFTYTSGNAPATANTGLSGGDLNVNAGKLNPAYNHLDSDQHHYWFVCDTGVIYSTDGAATWNKITKATLGDPTNTAGDASPPDTDDLDEVSLDFDPTDRGRVYVLRVTNSTWNASNDPRAFLYWTDDYGATWSSFGLGLS